MHKKIIETPLAPSAIGPYSQATVYQNMMYISGQLGLNHETMTLPEDFITEVKNALYNLKSIVEAGGSKMERVLKVTVLLADMDDFKTVNDIYYKFFPENCPARECFAVKTLPKNARIEISAIAFVREDS